MEHELEEVFAWLEARDAADYQAGVLLLQQHCKNRSMVAGLLRKESPTNREKLIYELVKVGCGGRMEDVSEVLNHFAQAVQGAVPLMQQVADVLTGQDFPEQPEPEHVPEQLRPQLDDLTQLMSKVYQQRCQLSNSLATLSEIDAPRVVAEILNLQEQYNKFAEKRRNLVAGEQPTAPAEVLAPDAPAVGSESAAPSIDRAELLQRRGNLRSQLSKNRGKATSSKTTEKRAEYEERAAKIQVELTTVEMQLKA